MLTAVVLTVTVVIPPISVSVHAAPDIPRELVTRALDEAEAIWRAADVTFSWETRDDVGGSLFALRVTINDDPGPQRDRDVPIGWIVFDSLGAPTRDIRLSYANAMGLVRAVEGTAAINRMTVLELRTHLARVLGRALAHELGHYLLASKTHTPTGLMKAKRSASEFLRPSRSSFEVDPSLKSLVRSQLMLADSLARR